MQPVHRTFTLFTYGAAAHRATVTRVLRQVEAVLLEGGQRTARRNAWDSVCADRSRARARREASDVLAALAPAGERGARGGAVRA